jgi:lysozyme family protein
MATLTDAMLDELLVREGGLIDHPADPGGLTKYGISQRAYPQEDIRNLTPARAKFLFRRDYWEKPRWGDIPDDGLALQVFDHGVNAGLGRAFRLLSRTLKLKTEAPFWNPALREALAATTDWPALGEVFLKERLRYYRGLALKTPKLGVFLKGWTRRAQEVAAEAATLRATPK